MGIPPFSIGIMPNSFWPIPADDGHAERLFVDEPNLRVLLEVFTKKSRSPLHVHTHADRFLYIAEGEITIVSPKTCTQLKQDQGIIIRANHSHGFLIPAVGANLISISIGPGTAQSKSHLPEHICQAFAPLLDKQPRIQAFQHETRWKDLYSQFEVQTMQWVKQAMLHAITSHEPLPFDLESHKQEATIAMQGWKTPRAFILKVKGHSYGFSYHQNPGNEYIELNRVFTLRFAMNRSDKQIPVLK